MNTIFKSIEKVFLAMMHGSLKLGEGPHEILKVKETCIVIHLN